MDKLVQEFCAEDKQRRVNIFQRENGTFYFQEERLSHQEFEQSWISIRQSVASFFDTQETAVYEAKGRIDWLNDLLFWSEWEAI